MADCNNCTEKCPQAERAHETALGRMYATQELVELIKKIESGQLVEAVKSNEEIEKAISVLNVYRNAYYKEPSGTVKYAVADAINTILPLFAKCLERRTDGSTD